MAATQGQFRFNGKADDEDSLNASINTTPLVDVMLVLLIIFLITIPVVTHSVPVHLPKERNVPSQSRPDNVVLAVTADGTVYWNTQRLPDAQALAVLLKTAAVKQPQPEVQVRGDEDAPYEAIGRILLAVQRAGIGKVGFITEPPAPNT